MCIYIYVCTYVCICILTHTRIQYMYVSFSLCICQSAENLVQWFHTHGPPEVVSWNRRQTEHGEMRVPLPTRRGYLRAPTSGEGGCAARATYEQCCYVRSAYQLGLVRDLYGRKKDSLLLMARLVQYIEQNVGTCHLMSFLPAFQVGI